MSDLLNVQPQTEMKEFKVLQDSIVSLQEKYSALVDIKSYEDTLIAVEIRKEAKSLEKDIEEKRDTMVRPMNDMVGQINKKAKEIKQPILDVVADIDAKVKVWNDEQQRIAEEKAREERERAEKERKEREEQERKIREEEDKKRREEEERIREQQRIADEKLKQAQNATDEVERKKAEEESKIAQERAQLEKEKADFEERKRQEEEDRRNKIEEDRQNEETLNIAKASETEKVKGTKTRWTFEIVDHTKIPVDYMTADEKKIREAIKNGVRIIP